MSDGGMDSLVVSSRQLIYNKMYYLSILMRTQTLRPGVWPPLLWMDSTTAVAKWAGVTVPAAIDHANAKEKRFLSWAEKVSYVRYMNLAMKWIPGSTNDFADLLSRMADRIGEAVKQRENVPMMYALGKSVETEKEEGDGTPAGYTAVHLALSTEEWQSVAEAYYSDEGRVQSVRVSELYRTVSDNGAGVSSEMAMKITPWIGRRYFSVKPPGSDRSMLYVPRGLSAI